MAKANKAQGGLFSMFEDTPPVVPPVEPEVKPPVRGLVPSSVVFDEYADDPLEAMLKWAEKTKTDVLLCEAVVRSKMVEANHLHAGGTRAEMEYLMAAYEGDTDRLRRDIMELAQFIWRHRITVVGAMSEDLA